MLAHMARQNMSPAPALFSAIMNLKPIGSHTAHICEATDAAYSNAEVKDGSSGDTGYPFGQIKPLLTVGEFDKATGFMLVGVPDGMGAYLVDDSTVRIIFQSESYGTFGGAGESFPFLVNNNGASFTGSHVMYVDYDRGMLADFMSHDESAEHMVKAAGDVITGAFNLNGKLVEPRNKTGCTAQPHYSNTDPNGCGLWHEINNVPAPEQADYVLQSLCAAHLEERHQWGQNLGVEDNLFITNEEWIEYVGGSNYVGIPAHVIDLATGHMHATGVFTLGGFEKIVEVNCGVEGYVCFSPSGYNGNFGVPSKTDEAARKNALGKRPDGTDYVYPQDIVPGRLYIGKKGYNAQGQPASDFLSRNGLAYGKVYGFSTDVTATTGGMFIDAYSRVMPPGSKVEGAFYPIDWQWDGTVKSFMHDGSWAFQHLTVDGTPFWTGNGRDASAAKTEHNSPDPYGGPRFIHGSTAGWIGLYDFTGVASLIAAAHQSSSFPAKIPAHYTLLQGEQDITSQIELGGKGRKANGAHQTHMSDSYKVASDGTVTDSAKVTFEDIDGLEWIAAAGTADGYVIIQEDGGNDFGERTIISKVETSGKKMAFYFIAQSGGDDNTRNKAGVGVPAGTNLDPGAAHEFSGSMDLSGMLAKNSDGSFKIKAGAPGSKREAEATVNVNEKILAMGLQAHSLNGGVIHAFRGDRGGQLYAYRPKLP
eukprot:TRINITY_DN7180_c0_g1_i2.p1 TRINITY_DN7180_c0_g1~~TRINITY_DN7180_c0_g1_i2.p1  ORF type:complete len:807 (-),score=143.12 TRINITY_DN7180_c0_g1_i2:210-2318(-)